MSASPRAEMQAAASSSELSRLRAASRALLSPLEHAEGDGWRAAVNAALCGLVGAERAAFSLPHPPDTPIFSHEHPAALLERYRVRYAARDPWRLRARERGVQVYSWGSLWDGDLTVLHRSDVFREWYQPAGIRDSVGLVIEYPGAALAAAVMLHHGRPAAWGSGGWEMEALEFLLPAFRTGVELSLAFARERASLGRVLDALDRAVLLVDGRGRVAHANRPYLRMVEPADERARIRDEAVRLAAALLRERGEPAPVVRDVEGTRGRYRLRGAHAGELLFGGDPLVLVTADRLQGADGAAPTDAELQERFGLTQRECDVARLLARRRTNVEISRALFVSPSTARHHTEHVLLKLGLHSRDQVEERLRLAAGGGGRQTA